MRWDFPASLERYIQVEHRDIPSQMTALRPRGGQVQVLAALTRALELNLEMEVEAAKQRFGSVPRGEESYIPSLLARLEAGQRIYPHEIGVSLLIDKSRRQGVTALIKAIMAIQCNSLEGRACLLMAHNEETAQEEIGRDLKRVLENWPPEWIQMRQGFKPSMSQFNFENGSRISIKTAGNVTDREASRGWRFDIYHFSEYAHYNTYADVRATELIRPKHAWVFKESTANGKGNPFYTEWIQAHTPEEAWALWQARKDDPAARERLREWGVPKHQYRVFLSWLDDPGCTTPVYDFEADEYTEDKLSDSERAIRARHGDVFSPERIKWYRALLKGAEGHPLLEPEAFRAQEYPTDWEESFQETGTQLFDPTSLDLIEAKTKTDRPIIKMRVDGRLPPAVKRHGGANCLIYKMPQKGRSYIVGADASQGLKGRRDFHFATVWDQHDGTFFEEVCSFWSREIDAVNYGHVATFLAELYLNAFIVPEVQGGGLALCTTVVHMNRHVRIFRRTTPDSIQATGELNVFRFGVFSSPQIKDLYVQLARQMVGDRDENARRVPRVLIRTPELLRQFRMYKRHDDGSLGAPIGDYDDGAVSAMLAWWGARQAPPHERYDTKRAEEALALARPAPDASMSAIQAATQAKVRRDVERAKRRRR